MRFMMVVFTSRKVAVLELFCKINGYIFMFYSYEKPRGIEEKN